MSVDCPWKPPEGWWISIRPLASVERLPGAPPARSSARDAHRDPAADRLHVGRDELHRVVDRQAGVDLAARRVDVHADVAVGVGGLQVQELGDDEVGDLVVDRRAEEDDRARRAGG